jgi:hypothetical protein
MSSNDTESTSDDDSDRSRSKHVSAYGDEIDTDWGTLFDPGFIKVGDPAHRRLLEDVGEDDNWRVVFIGDAAAMDGDGGAGA